MYCHNCGKEVPDNIKFCSECGAELTNNKILKKKYDGEIRKCPNCGETLKAFETKCSTCGYEIRNSKASNAIEEFAKQLNDIEGYKSERRVNLKTLIFGNYGYDSDETKKINELKSNFIKNYAIPNNKEDLYEFLIMAVSNLDTNYLVKKMKELGVNKETYIGYKKLNEAWYVKMKQAYEKAKLAFDNDEDFNHISEMFLEKQKEINSAKKSKLIKKIVIWGVVIILFILGTINNYRFRNATNEEKNVLQKVEECREEDIMPIFIKDYEAAEFSKFNSYASENGLGGSQIYVDGVCESVFPILFENGITGYSMKLKINDSQTWLINLDTEQSSIFEVYKKLVTHKLRVKGIYSGFSDLYKLPAIHMKQIYDFNDELLITSGTF